MPRLRNKPIQIQPKAVKDLLGWKGLHAPGLVVAWIFSCAGSAAILSGDLWKGGWQGDVSKRGVGGEASHKEAAKTDMRDFKTDPPPGSAVPADATGIVRDSSTQKNKEKRAGPVFAKTSWIKKGLKTRMSVFRA